MYKLRVNSFFISLPYSESDIEFAKESTGFNYYLPKLFLIDVINFIAHKAYGNIDIFKFEDKVTKFLQSIPQFIWERTKKEYNILNKTLYILKYCGDVIDLKAIEENNIKEINDKNDNFLNNAKFEFTLTSELTANAEQSVKILNILHNLFSKTTDSSIVKEKVTGYKKITKIKKSVFARPDFSYLITKEISNRTIEDKSERDIIIFIEDTSKSMMSGKNKDIANTVKFFLSQMNEEIHYFTKSFDNIEFIKLTTKEEKTEFFSTVKFKRDFYDYKLILNHISKLYSNQKIILLCDTDDYIPKDIHLNNEIYVLNTKHEKSSVNNLCKLNKGKQICL
jgi:hypothetical protein